MELREKTREFLIAHYQRYPHLQMQDIFKFVYQSSFGCEHLVSDLDSAIMNIRREQECCHRDENHLLDELDGDYCRIHLSFLKQGLSVKTLGKLFVKSAKKELDGIRKLETKLEVVWELVREGKLPFSERQFEEAVAAWKLDGYSAIRHSDTFRMNYRPAYRVIANEYVSFLPLLAKVDSMLEKSEVVVAIDGGSASGKTTLSEFLAEIYDCTVLHMDDFFLRAEQRTPERLKEVGGNVDRERFLEEVLIPLSRNEVIQYRRFDCTTQTISDSAKIIPKKLTIIEGAYSMHPDFEKYYDLSVFLDISPELQKKRIEKRNTPQMAERFFQEWIPLEKTYFSQMQVEQRCDISISVNEVDKVGMWY